MKNLRVWRWYYYLWRKRKWRIWEFLWTNWNEEVESLEILSLKKEEIKNWRVFGNRNLGNEESEVWGWKGWYYYDVFGEGENKELESLWKWRIWEFEWWKIWKILLVSLEKEKMKDSRVLGKIETKNLRVWRKKKNWRVFRNRNSRNEESESLERKGWWYYWYLWRKRK